MSERMILVTTLDSAAWPGQFICTPDADYPLGSVVPDADYAAEDQDWQHVISRRGHADIGQLTLAYHNGDQHVEEGLQWGALCWLLVDRDHNAIVQDVDE